MEAINTALTSWGSGLLSDVSSTIGVLIPSALGIAGLFIATKLGVKFFKGVAK